MPMDPSIMDYAMARAIGCSVEELRYADRQKAVFLAGAVYGFEGAKLSQAEIAVIVAAVATEKEKTL